MLAEDAAEIPIVELRGTLLEDGIRPLVTVEGGSDDRWSRFALRPRDTEYEIALIERNPVLPGKLGEDEIKEFVAEV